MKNAWLAFLWVLISLFSCSAASAEDPSDVVRRTYGWHLERQVGIYSYASFAQERKQLLLHERDFAPELFRILKAIDDMEEECRSGKRKLMTWDNDPLTWSDSMSFEEPLRVSTITNNGKEAVVTITTKVAGVRTEHVPMQWYVDLVKNGSHWQIADLRFPMNGFPSQISVLKELHKNFHY